MNALSLYITTCRSILQTSPDDNSTWADIHRLLTYLRQTLLCCVCGNLLIVPMTSRACHQHGICKSCLGRPVSCTRCKENGFIEDTQLKIVLQCYKQLCSYLLCTAAHRQWGSLNGGNGLNFSDLLQEGASYSDDSNRDSESSDDHVRNDSSAVNGTRGVTNGVYSGRRNRTEAGLHDTLVDSPRKRLRTQTKNKSTKHKERRGCRCGMTTANPGKLTCYGQRCPCYANNTSCANCCCRGCHNPYVNCHDSNSRSDNEVSFDHCYLQTRTKKK